MTDRPDPTDPLERLFDGFEHERWEAYPELLTDDVVAHENGEEIRGLEEQLDFEQDYKQTHPDAAVTVKEMATSGTTVFPRSVAPGGGTHLLYSHVEDGKIAEVWVLSE